MNDFQYCLNELLKQYCNDTTKKNKKLIKTRINVFFDKYHYH